MAEEAELEKSQSGALYLKWAIVLGIVFLIVVGIVSSRSIHSVLIKKSLAAESNQTTGSQVNQ